MSKPDDGDDRMEKKSENVAHARDGIKLKNLKNSGLLRNSSTTGSDGELKTPVFTDSDISVVHGGKEDVYRMRNPPHVHQPLIQTIVDELLGRGTCPSTGETGARTSWVMDRCLTNYYG